MQNASAMCKKAIKSDVIVVVAEKRMTNIVVGLTNDDPHTNPPVYKQYYHVQFDGTVEVSATITVEFPSSQEKYRYVIIQNKFSHNEAICMAEVKVYVRGMHAFVVVVVAVIVLVVALVERWTRDRKVAGSTPGRGAIKSTRSTQPSIPPV